MRVRCLALAVALLSCAAPAQVAGPAAPEPARAQPQHLVSSELNVVARIDWQGAPIAVRGPILDYARAVGFGERLLRLMDGCLQHAKELWLGARVTRQGLQGDALAIAAGGGRHPQACGATGWHQVKRVGDTTLWQPAATDADRHAPALLGQHAGGFVFAATQGQVDPTLRILRDGPDDASLEPADGALVSLEAKLGPDVIPEELEAKVPIAWRLAQGLEHLRLLVDVGTAVRVRVTLTYGEADEAKRAGELLTVFREAMLHDDKPSWQAAARSAHASVVEEQLKLSFELER
jgi:hypothetical protein